MDIWNEFNHVSTLGLEFNGRTISEKELYRIAPRGFAFDFGFLSQDAGIQALGQILEFRASHQDAVLDLAADDAGVLADAGVGADVAVFDHGVGGDADGAAQPGVAHDRARLDFDLADDLAVRDGSLDVAVDSGKHQTVGI